MEGEKRCISWFWLDREILLALLVCLITVYQGVDARSISELLSDLEVEGDRDSQFLPQELDSSSGQVGIYDDLVDNIHDDQLPKRAPWAPYDVSVSSLRQKLLRSKMFNNRQKYSSSRDFRGGENENVPVMASKEFVDGYVDGWLNAKAQMQEDRQKEMDRAAHRENAGVLLGSLDKRSETHHEEGGSLLRSTSDIHPIFLGMGQETANAALRTFSSLLAEEEKRRNPDLPTNPVRFIGRR